MNLQVNKNWTNQINGRNKAKIEKKIEKRISEIKKNMKSQSVVLRLLSYDWDTIRQINLDLEKSSSSDLLDIYQDICNEIDSDILESRKYWSDSKVKSLVSEIEPDVFNI